MANTSWFLFALPRSYDDKVNYNWNTVYSATWLTSQKYNYGYQRNVKGRIIFK